MRRVVTGGIAAAAAVAGVLWLPSLAVFWVGLVLFEIAAWEYVGLCRRLVPGGSAGWLLVALPLVVGAWLVRPGIAAAALALAPFAYGVVLLTRGGEPRTAVATLGSLSFGTAYLAVPVWAIYELHVADRRILLVVLASVWLNDSAAFLVGSRWGRRRLAPRISPNKTVEGALAGLAGAALAAWGGAVWTASEAPARLVLLLLVTAVAAQAGDLVESVLKRAAGVKDSGAILPGHGGLLDRMDAIILAAPVFYVLFELCREAGL